MEKSERTHVMDDRPGRRRPDPVAVAGGAASVVAMLGLLACLPMLAAAQPVAAIEPPSGPGFEYIEARILRMGEVKDPNKLPDRIVPALPTAPDEVLPLDTNENKVEEPEKKPEKQADAVTDDKLRQVFDKARAFAEIKDDYVPEGRPDGVPEGDVTDPALASLGATYGLRIKRLFTERWVVPTLLSDEQLKSLKVKVNIRVDIDMTIVSVTFLAKTGNALFDDSVTNAIDRVRVEVRTLPAPPEAIAPKIFGGGINITFVGSEAKQE
ncbi:MAG: TonB C-terminal domain-containing protein [Deltaproteobacteria bacterium]|nr:TonB C-terminal domain-containing protein [Deltaproteobacteria bacterium]